MSAVSTRQKIFLSLAILVIFNLLLVIVFGDNGFVDVQLMKGERDRLTARIDQLTRENTTLYREIERLKHDLKYLENIARHELGMIGKDEVILKFKSTDSSASGEGEK